LAVFGQNFTLNGGSSAGKISNESILRALDDKRAGSYRAGALRRQQSSGQGDFTAGFLGGVNILQLSNLQGPGARARPALAPGPQQYRLVRSQRLQARLLLVIQADQGCGPTGLPAAAAQP